MQNNFEVIADKDSYVVINKPPGVVVNKVETQHAFTVQDWIEKRWNKKSGRNEIEYMSNILINALFPLKRRKTPITNPIDAPTNENPGNFII